MDTQRGQGGSGGDHHVEELHPAHLLRRQAHAHLPLCKVMLQWAHCRATGARCSAQRNTPFIHALAANINHRVCEKCTGKSEVCCRTQPPRARMCPARPEAIIPPRMEFAATLSNGSEHRRSELARPPALHLECLQLREQSLIGVTGEIIRLLQ